MSDIIKTMIVRIQNNDHRNSDRRSRDMEAITANVKSYELACCRKIRASNHIALGRGNVVFGAHSQQTIIEQENTQWTGRRNENIDPQVTLEPVDQQRLLDVFLDNDVLVRWNTLGISHQLNTTH